MGREIRMYLALSVRAWSSAMVCPRRLYTSHVDHQSHLFELFIETKFEVCDARNFNAAT